MVQRNRNLLARRALPKSKITGLGTSSCSWMPEQRAAFCRARAEERGVTPDMQLSTSSALLPLFAGQQQTGRGRSSYLLVTLLKSRRPAKESLRNGLRAGEDARERVRPEHWCCNSPEHVQETRGFLVASFLGPTQSWERHQTSFGHKVPFSKSLAFKRGMGRAESLGYHPEGGVIGL